MSLRLLYILVCLYSTAMEAQTLWCHSPDPAARADQNILYQKLAAKVKQYAATNIHSRTDVYLPIVVHVVTPKGSPDISAAQILNQIDVLNADFSGKGTNIHKVPDEFQPLIADTGIRFCLAKTDPQGNPTTGIVYRLTPIPNIGLETNEGGRISVYYTQFGGTDMWDPTRYINIWVCEIHPGILGSSSFPGMAPYVEETGIIIDYRYFGSMGVASYNSKFHDGHTLSHEMGHYLGLRHIWGAGTSGCNDDDGIDDTPLADGPYYGCPSGTQVSCDVSNMYHNFMDQTDDRCLAFFTPEQAQFMQAAIDLYYPDLAIEGQCKEVVSSFTSWHDNLLWVYDRFSSQYIIYNPEGYSPAFTLEVFSLDGRLVTRKEYNGYQSYHLDLDNVVAGIYIVRISDGEDDFVRKISVY